MMTLEDFQKQVLLPLRQERSKKLDSLQAEFDAIDYAYHQHCNDIHERKEQFRAEQQRLAREMKTRFQKESLEAEQFRRAGHADIKTRRTRINEAYHDAVGIAFARYNAERAQQGLPSVAYIAAGKPDDKDGRQASEQANEQTDGQTTGQQANGQKGGAL